jgi:hypothetical protein
MAWLDSSAVGQAFLPVTDECTHSSDQSFDRASAYESTSTSFRDRQECLSYREWVSLNIRRMGGSPMFLLLQNKARASRPCDR